MVESKTEDRIYWCHKVALNCVRVTSMNSRTRQDELVRMLRRRGSATIAELSRSLGASRRSILRDIANLRDQGFIIHSAAGPGGGITLDPTSILLFPKLVSSEVFALLITFAVLKQTHDIPFASLADAGLRKIEQSLPRERVLELRRILRNVYIGKPNPELPLPVVQTIKPSVLAVFETCFLGSQRMIFSYQDRNNKKTKRSADPHAMLVLSPAWYMIGYDPQKKEFRHFRMDRIKSASMQEETFHRRAFIVNEGECPFTTSFI